MEPYKEEERSHYDTLARSSKVPLDVSGADAVDEALRAPYAAFEKMVRERARDGAIVVDLGAGSGVHSLVAERASLRVAVDISVPALQLAALRGERNGVAIAPLVADAERLPFRSGSVDVVTSAGSLYCFDFDAVSAEISRVLRRKGAWVLVDSYDVNPIYRLNRRLGRMLGRRTQRAVENIPDAATLGALRRQFSRVEVQFHGVVAFLGPLLRRVVGARRAAAAIAAFDRAFPSLSANAFKIVACAEGPRTSPVEAAAR